MRHSSKLLAQALLVAATVPALAAPAQPPAHKVTSGQINLNFKDAEVDSVIGAFGHLLNKSFVIDPRVRGKISLETPRPVNRAQAFALLKTVPLSIWVTCTRWCPRPMPSSSPAPWRSAPRPRVTATRSSPRCSSSTTNRPTT